MNEDKEAQLSMNEDRTYLKLSASHRRRRRTTPALAYLAFKKEPSNVEVLGRLSCVHNVERDREKGGDLYSSYTVVVVVKRWCAVD